MAPKSHLRREDFLYDLEWVEATDKLFIDVLVDQAAIGNFITGHVNAHTVLIGRGVVNKNLT